ncbi:methyltransferase [Streptomyces sp. CRN 30]|uniref:methyltransferase n=1 Tax=Streptomyces sp. CRN 30 TaxID=3075613 RepID=UPI002A8347EF|nr:methyltransferase [Streptomyces sp. CRN 30]
MTRGHLQDAATGWVSSETSYDAYFGLGQVLRLLDRPGVFKLSPAGLALGDYLVRSTDRDVLAGRVLDIGTGSGAQALLLRGMGADDVVATDVSAPAVETAAENELLNFPDRRVVFERTSLFGDRAASGRFDLVVFNPPGWRTPSRECRRDLDRAGLSALDLSAMFSGETVLLDFLRRLPDHLTPSGRAVVGLNSMTGIREVFTRLAREQAGAALRFRLLERHSFPLFFYTRDWQKARETLLTEFRRWREEHGAAFSVDSDGTLHWSYEIVEIRLRSDGEVAGG